MTARRLSRSPPRRNGARCAQPTPSTPHPSPFGEWFAVSLEVAEARCRSSSRRAGKIAAAASTQYAIDRWAPPLVVNLGTCGGFHELIERGTIVLAERTVVYDIIERMGDPEAAIAAYATDLDLAWLGDDLPHPVRRGLLVSGDADLDPAPITDLHTRFGAVAGDWESGAIAHIAARNNVRCLILRGVSDLVSADGGEAYDGTPSLRRERGRGERT
ncbi:MAG: 5'-methylthioadenosine/S-adenosylhomocysteine nucleosidase [Thermomicrobiales bacterium]